MLAFIERRKERLWTFEHDMRHQLIERLKDTFGYWSDQSDTFRRKLVIILNHNFWGNTSHFRRQKTRESNCFFKDYDLPLWLSANKWGSLVGKKADTWKSASNACLPAQNHPLSECLLLTTAKLWLELNSGQKHGKKCVAHHLMGWSRCLKLLSCVLASRTHEVGHDVDGDREDDCAVVLRCDAVQRLQVPQLKKYGV